MSKLIFSGLTGGFSLCACAQQGQLRWPARKRERHACFNFFLLLLRRQTGFSASLLAQKRSVLPSRPFQFARGAACPMRDRVSVRFGGGRKGNNGGFARIHFNMKKVDKSDKREYNMAVQ